MRKTLKKVPFAGFTLIELMITVVILAILIGIAYPAYRNYSTQARRADAKAGIQQVANRLEKFFTYCNSYTTDITATWPSTCPPIPTAGTWGLQLPSNLSPDQHYLITVAADDVDGSCAGAGLVGTTALLTCGYTITANPNGAGTTGRQRNDGSFQLDSRGIKRWDRNNNGTYDTNERTWKEH